jgi:hypothetical protein
MVDGRRENGFLLATYRADEKLERDTAAATVFDIAG